jgi:hypothetical protein
MAHSEESSMNRAEECKEYLQKNGWTKHYMKDREGRVCMLGSIVGTAEINWNSSYGWNWDTQRDLIVLMRDVILEQFPDRASKNPSDMLRIISSFNDHPDTTEDDAELVFEKTAVKLEELL